MFQSLCKIGYKKNEKITSEFTLIFFTNRFIRSYRLPPALALLFIDEIRPFVNNIGEVPFEIQILSVLNFYATGSYQQ